jgi:hypothetical protein
MACYRDSFTLPFNHLSDRLYYDPECSPLLVPKLATVAHDPTEKVRAAIAFKTCVQEMHDFNLGWDTDKPH